ncbi:MAG: GTP cyclohydrolase, FolE2/MptA family [Verrucomicrobiales bacterium]
MQELKDTQNEPDHRNLSIDRVGVRQLRFPVQVLDKANSRQNTVATVSLAVDLPHHYKGTHMSRFVEVLNSHGPVLEVRAINRIPQELLKRLHAERAHVQIRFPFFSTSWLRCQGLPV